MVYSDFWLWIKRLCVYSIAVNGTPTRSYRMSLAMCDFLPQVNTPCPARLVLDLPTPEGWKVELTVWLKFLAGVIYLCRYSGCLQLLEVLAISWNLIGPPGNFCVRCQRLTALVSNHKTGNQITYLKKQVALFYFIFATAPCCIKCISYFCSVHYIGGRSKANMSWIFLKIPPGISLKSPGNLLD